MKKEKNTFAKIYLIYIVCLLVISFIISYKYNFSFIMVFAIIVFAQGFLVVLAIPLMDLRLAKLRMKWEEKNRRKR